VVGTAHGHYPYTVFFTRLPATVFMHCYVLATTGWHTQMDGNCFFSCPVMDLNYNYLLFCTEDPDSFAYNLLTNHYRKFTPQRVSIKEQCSAIGIFLTGWMLLKVGEEISKKK